MSDKMKCPIAGGYEAIESKRIGGAIGTPPMNANWWPGQLPIELLHSQSPSANPLGEDFDYPAAFASLDLDAVKKRYFGTSDHLTRFLASGLRQLWPSDD